MTKDDRRSQPPAQPELSARGRRAESERQARVAAALRENLARRKRQQRARAAPIEAGQDARPAGGDPEPDVE